MKGIFFKCAPDDKARWESEAQREGLGLSAWIRRRLDSIPQTLVEGGWRCRCGRANDGEFCEHCGRSRAWAQ